MRIRAMEDMDTPIDGTGLRCRGQDSRRRAGLDGDAVRPLPGGQADVMHPLGTSNPRRADRSVLIATLLGLVVAALWFAPGTAGAALRQSTTDVETAMTAWKAALLGAVEGLTEYLPISSTGHLLVVSRWLGLGASEADREAANTYAIAIQFGAILAVAGLFWQRFRDMVLGLFGRSESGRHLLIVSVVAFLPAAVLGFLFDDAIEERLFGPWPVIAAWVLGGALILVLERAGLIPHHGEPADPDHDPVRDITVRQALVVGLAQCAALWPGTSRSLATILGALLVGVGMTAAVEFSFILGFLTLSAATGYKLVTDGGGLVEQFGVLDPLIGLVSAFVFAVLAIKWMIRYLERNSLAIFGWYRLAVAALAAALVIGGQL
jgi:undecaprenyl-diphosphatase